MTFLNPAMLWGLLALAVPIIVHFFNLQRPKEVLFSNVAFVREVKKSVVRRLQFKQWLLLLARLLAISLLVLAFANPVIVDPDRQQLQGNRSVAIVLDNSFSMTAGNEKGNYFAQAQSLARQIIQAHGKQDEFLLMTSAQLQLNAGFLTSEEAVENIRQLQYSQQTRTHGEILGFAPRFFSLASNQAKELYFISDFQQSTVLADSQRVSLEDSSILIKYLPLASRTQQNVYIKDQVIDSRILSKGKPVVMKMTLVNDGSQPVNELGVRVNLEGKVVAIANQSLDPSATAELELTFTPENSGWLSGFIELDDYPIEFDNRRYFFLYQMPEKYLGTAS
ncbi:MAG: BatA domain-containing protein [Bacteroidota bacterium]